MSPCAIETGSEGRDSQLLVLRVEQRSGLRRILSQGEPVVGAADRDGRRIASGLARCDPCTHPLPFREARAGRVTARSAGGRPGARGRRSLPDAAAAVRPHAFRRVVLLGDRQDGRPADEPSLDATKELVRAPLAATFSGGRENLASASVRRGGEAGFRAAAARARDAGSACKPSVVEGALLVTIAAATEDVFGDPDQAAGAETEFVVSPEQQAEVANRLERDLPAARRTARTCSRPPHRRCGSPSLSRPRSRIHGGG